MHGISETIRSILYPIAKVREFFSEYIEENKIIEFNSSQKMLFSSKFPKESRFILRILKILYYFLKIK